MINENLKIALYYALEFCITKDQNSISFTSKKDFVSGNNTDAISILVTASIGNYLSSLLQGYK
jgi:hypothetical protein